MNVATSSPFFSGMNSTWARNLRNNGAGEQGSYSSWFLYKLCDRFALFNPLRDPETGRVLDGPVLEDDANAMKLLMADYKRSSGQAEVDEARDASEKDIKLLLAQYQPKHRMASGLIKKLGELDTDGALLARFPIFLQYFRSCL